MSDYRSLAFRTYPHCCDLCGNVERLEAHHRDVNNANNAAENLQILCCGCHRRLHGQLRRGQRRAAGPRRGPMTIGLPSPLAQRVRVAADRQFQGKRSMVIREALHVYLDLRDALGYDFDRTIQPLRMREVEVPA